MMDNKTACQNFSSKKRRTSKDLCNHDGARQRISHHNGWKHCPTDCEELSQIFSLQTGQLQLAFFLLSLEIGVTPFVLTSLLPVSRPGFPPDAMVTLTLAPLQALSLTHLHTLSCSHSFFFFAIFFTRYHLC